MRQEDFDATHLVKAVKGLPIHRSAHTTVTIGGRRVKITEKTKDMAIEWFAEWAAPLVDALGIQPKIVVPISSSSTVGKDPATFRTAKLASEVAKRCTTQATAFPFLRWKEAKPNSRNGGTRDSRLLYQNLTLSRDLPPGDCVLVDDVCTKGGHLVAAVWFLESHTRTVLGAVCCGRTSSQRLEEPFKVEIEHFDVGERPDG